MSRKTRLGRRLAIVERGIRVMRTARLVALVFEDAGDEVANIVPSSMIRMSRAILTLPNGPFGRLSLFLGLERFGGHGRCNVCRRCRLTATGARGRRRPAATAR